MSLGSLFGVKMPKVPPPVPPPSTTDAEIEQARMRERRAALAAGGRRSTDITMGAGGGYAPGSKLTLGT